jgi:gluconolactonase
MKRAFTTLVLLITVIFSMSAADFDIKNEAEFKKLLPADAKVEKLAGDMGFVEGPVWVPADGGYLVFSDIPNNELKKWSKAGGLATFRKPSNNANGNTLDLQGRLTTAEHSGRRISVTDKDGAVQTVVDSFE